MVIVLVGIGSLALLLWEPHIEGRNAHATLFQIYFNDPFLAYAYTASIAFFVALYQAFSFWDTYEAVKSSRKAQSKHCGRLSTALSLFGFLVGAEAYFFLAVRGKDDTAGGVMMGLLLIFVSAVVAAAVAAAAAVFERTLQSGVELKSENDLTV